MDQKRAVPRRFPIWHRPAPIDDHQFEAFSRLGHERRVEIMTVSREAEGSFKRNEFQVGCTDHDLHVRTAYGRQARCHRGSHNSGRMELSQFES